MQPDAPILSKFTPSTGVALAVHSWGGDGPPVLLAHPTGFHGRAWDPVARRLVAAGRSVWSFDFRGHGDSDPSPDGRYSWHEFADDALAVTDHLGLAGDADLLACGHSKGGAALMLGALREPAAYPRLWCYEPIVVASELAMPDGIDNPLSRSALRRRAQWSSRAEARDSYGSKAPLDALHAEALDAYVNYGMRDLEDGGVALKCAPEHEAQMYAMSARNGLYEHLSEVPVPVLVACGATSNSITPQLATRIVELLPHGTLEVWQARGHFGPLEDPDRAVVSMLEFATKP
jgi:pimeloyl-ACP methyl ester carboxylesterase